MLYIQLLKHHLSASYAWQTTQVYLLQETDLLIDTLWISKLWSKHIAIGQVQIFTVLCCNCLEHLAVDCIESLQTQQTETLKRKFMFLNFTLTTMNTATEVFTMDVGFGGSVVGWVPCTRKVAGSNPTLVSM